MAKSGQFTKNSKEILTTILTQYGLSPDCQIQLMQLLQLAGTLSLNSLEADLHAVSASATEIEHAKQVIQSLSNHASLQATAKNLLTSLFLAENISQTTYPWPQTAHTWLLRATQRALFARDTANSTERWEMINLQWMDENLAQIEAFVNNAGLLNAKIPVSSYEAGAVLGANYYEMLKRINFAVAHQKHMKTIYLLTGDRDLSPNIDNQQHIDATKAFFSQINATLLYGYFSHLAYPEKAANSFLTAQNQRITEAGMMLYLAHLAKLPCYLINAPKPAGKPRSTTITTVEQWIKEASSMPATILGISNAPYLNSQKADLELAISTNADWKKAIIAIAGDRAASHYEYTSHYPEFTLSQYWREMIEPFGGFIYGAFSLVALKLHSKLSLKQLNSLRSQQSFSKQKSK